MGNRHLETSRITRIERINQERRAEFGRTFDRPRRTGPDIRTVLEHLRRLNAERESLMADFGR